MMPASMKGQQGNSSTAMVVTIDEVEDSAFDVPFPQLDIDNSHKRSTVRLFCNEGGYQKIIGGSDLRSRNPKTGEVEEDSSFNSGEGGGSHSHSGGSHSHSSDRGSSQPSIRSITIAQPVPTIQIRRTIYFLQRYRRKESMDMKSNGLWCNNNLLSIGNCKGSWRKAT
eukprot:scaffold15000_cov143-Skeletonema_dohrnii-CCMP3373.AAC.5